MAVKEAKGSAFVCCVEQSGISLSTTIAAQWDGDRIYLYTSFRTVTTSENYRGCLDDKNHMQLFFWGVNITRCPIPEGCDLISTRSSACL